MEPTGYYWKLLAAELEKHAIPYRLVNAYTVKKHREGDQLDRAKDDERDSFAIADLLRTGKFTETQRLQGAYAELREYSTHCVRLRQEASRQRTLLRMTVSQMFPELREVFGSFDAQTVTALLTHHAAASHIRSLTEEAFIAQVRADFGGKRLQVSKLRKAYQLAQTSIGLEETQALQLATQCYLDDLTLKQAQIEQVGARLVDTFLSLPYAPYMLSLNLGVVTTAQIAAELGDPAQFRSAKQWVKLAGIQPSPNSSGKKTNSPTPMSGKGRARLRTLLYLACLRRVQYDEAYACYYRQLQTRPKNPLCGMQALGKLMDRTLHLLWAVIRDRSMYDPACWQFQRL